MCIACYLFFISRVTPHLSHLFSTTEPTTAEIYTLSLHDALPISGGIRLPLAVGAGQPAHALRRVGGDQPADHLRFRDAGTVRGRACRARGRAGGAANGVGRSADRSASGADPGR